MTALAAVIDDPVTLDELAVTATREYDAVGLSEQAAFDHAIRCGQALNDAQDQMPRREFYAWRKALFADRFKSRSRLPLFQRMAARQHELRQAGVANIHQADIRLRRLDAGAETRARRARAASRRRAAQHALERQERSTAMRKIGGKADEAFSLVVKAQQQLDRVKVDDPRRRRLLSEAYMDLVSAEEKIWKAVAEHAPDR